MRTVLSAMKVILIMVIGLASATRAEAKGCNNRGSQHVRTDKVAKATRVGDVVIAPGGEIRYESRWDLECQTQTTFLSSILLVAGGTVCNQAIARGIGLTFDGDVPKVGFASTSPRRQIALFTENSRATLTVNGIAVRADLAVIACTKTAEIISGTLAKDARVFGSTLHAGSSFGGESGCFTNLDLTTATTVGAHAFPAMSRVRFDACRPEALAYLGDKTHTRFEHDGVACLVDNQGMSIDKTTGKITYCPHVESFGVPLLGATRTLEANTLAKFHPDGKLSEGVLLDDTFFGIALEVPEVKVAADGKLLEVRGVLRGKRLIGKTECNGWTTLDGSGVVVRCENF